MGEQVILYKSSDHAINLNKMRLEEKWCDVTIKVNGKNFRAHKFVLAANLEYFDIMLSSGTFIECKEAIVSMEGIEDIDIMEAMIGFAYTGEFLITANNAFKSLKMADYLCEDRIRNTCIAFLEKHLKEEEAVGVYTFAKAIGCASLKNVAREKIVRNFELCRQTNDYLNFDYEDMSDILSDGKAQSDESQSDLFDGIMEWMKHDVQRRKDQLIDLLSFIDITKFSTDYLMCYLFEIEVDRNDGIFRDVMHHYYINKIKQEERAKVLVVVGNDDERLDVWFYNFRIRAWSQMEQMPVVNGQFCSQIVVLNDKLYYLLGDEDGDRDTVFQVLDLTTKQYTTLNSSIHFEDDAAICANDNFVYLCGGMTSTYPFSNAHTCSLTNQVLRYNIETNTMSAIEPMKVKRGMAAAIFYQGYLLVIGGCDRSVEKFDLVEKYDPETKTWTDFPSLLERRHSHAVAILNDKLYVCGGHNSKTVEVYDPATNSWKFVASMNKRRWSFLLVVHEGKLLAMGQDGKLTAEVYDPSKDLWQLDEDLSRGLGDLELRGGLVSASCVVDS